jgi:hypothetical protein
MASRPATVTVWYRGIPYSLNLVRCRRALVDRQVAGELDSMESLAKAVGVSRSTASRFFSGRGTSLTVTLAILKVLKLRFDDVAKPQREEDAGDEPEGDNSVGIPSLPKPKPIGGSDGAARKLDRRHSA